MRGASEKKRKRETSRQAVSRQDGASEEGGEEEEEREERGGVGSEKRVFSLFSFLQSPSIFSLFSPDKHS